MKTYKDTFKYTWTRTKGPDEIEAPNPGGKHDVGDLFIHVHDNGTQTWVWAEEEDEMVWKPVVAQDAHPVVERYGLGTKDELQPSWVLMQTTRSYKSLTRREKKTDDEELADLLANIVPGQSLRDDAEDLPVGESSKKRRKGKGKM